MDLIFIKFNWEFLEIIFNFCECNFKKINLTKF